ncbi:DUF6480 family protein [Streptomyces sp. fd1-xmd]|uniref:DUF6480 family protein n=1 Tax=Streptomyces sp. fd1-xmd TaxID=1812480 RepID=UPI000990778C|nr:DUF6480 family protein [Streptomyces sp. fd1-xmd]AQT70767.1 hypothetical protein B1K54_02635 [Streptomyces sp. fd1-xmd]
MSSPRIPPGETPPAEGSISSAHQERSDGGIWEHPGAFLVTIVVGAVLVAFFFVARAAGW